MDDKKFTGSLIPKSTIYIWIISMLVAVIAFLNWKVGIFGIILVAFLIYYNSRTYYTRIREITRHIENLTLDIDNVTKDTLLNFPLPLVFIELDGNIVWYNSLFKNIFGSEELLDNPISKFAEELHPDGIGIQSGVINRQVEIKGRQYNVLGNFIKTSVQGEKANIILMIYLIDNTGFFELKQKYQDEKSIVSLMVIDNYDDLMQSVEDSGRPLILAEIEKKVTSWAVFTGGILKKFERDKYLFIFQAQHFKTLEEKRFEVLDSVKEINAGNKIPVTLSVGLGMNGKSLAENFTYAAASIDIALGRGGDQVVVKSGEDISFYGGRTRELEKRTRVKARVIAYALRELIQQASQVFIMGHENVDIDSLGAALGLYRVAKNKGKKAYIILNYANPGINNLLMRLDRDGEYEGLFLNRTEALNAVDKKTLLIVVDTHRPAFTECPELLKATGQIVVIDHHRRGSEFIQDAVLTYQETYASSTSELVTEILQYIDDKIKLNILEAEALYAGIVTDTKHFTFKTGVRTFEAASFLRRQGVDTVSVKQLFQNDLETYITRSNVVRDAEIISDRIAISICPTNIRNAPLIAAQAADELLSLSGINAAFVLCSSGNEIMISGRSMGDINVQVILEKLGGGGHLTVAGAQLENVSMEEARERLKVAIAWYLESNSNVKE